MAGPLRVPRLIASDLDGTFLSPDGSVSAENAAAVRRAQAAGIAVVFATGRPVRWLEVIQDLPGAHPVVIASNGAVLYDLGSRQVLDRMVIEAETALEAVALIRAAVPGTSFGFESGALFGHEQAYVVPAIHDSVRYVGEVAELARADGLVKLLAKNVDIGPDDLLHRVREAVGDLLTPTHSTTATTGLVELSARGVSKAAMLQRVCEREQVDAADVAAFGDMPNDLDMLSWVGMPHIVASAHPLLLQMAFTVVGSNRDSGVGRAIERWL